MAADNRTDIIVQPLVTASPSASVQSTLAPAVMGSIGVVVGLFVFLILSQKADPAEGAGIRLFGVFFLLFGMLFTWHGASRTRALVAARRRQRLPEPWLRDWPWQREQRTRNARLAVPCLLTVVFGSLLAPFHVVWTSSSGTFWAGVAFFDLVWLAMALTFVYRLVQWLRFGRARVTWHTFPARPGTQLQAAITVTRTVRNEEATVRLRAIEELAQTADRGSADNARELWAQEQKVQGREGRYDLAFQLPANVAGSHISKAGPIYWKLEASVPVPGPDFAFEMLAPVYDASFAGGGEGVSGEAVTIRRNRRQSAPPNLRRTMYTSAVVGMLMSAATLGTTRSAWDRWSTDAQTAGVIVRHEPRESQGPRGAGSPTYAAVIQYNVRGETYEITQAFTSGTPMYAIGATVPVIYQADDPSFGEIKTIFGTFFVPGMFAVVSLGFLGGAVLAWSLSAGDANVRHERGL
jgi:hypothetical protein